MSAENRQHPIRGFIRALVTTSVGVLAVTSASADSAVVLGAGQLGRWVTIGSVSNPNSSRVDLVVAPTPPINCPGSCPFLGIALPPLATSTLDFTFPPIEFGFGIVYVSQISPETPGQTFPVTQARIHDQTNAVRAVDVPVILLSRLVAVNPSSLFFPGVRREPIAPGFTSYSNLFLGNVQRPDATTAPDLPLKIELFDVNGNLVGSNALTIPYGQMIAIDPIDFAGGSQPVTFQGQVRVTRTSGDALLWGILYSIDENNAVTASVGMNLSP